ncbi:MAG TPA: hypothetical protein ENH24_05100 [Nitrospirae bacterium]|nr:hypothetical protein [Nitrospirota bacterium]
MKKLGIALITLLVGCLIYILWRSETLMMFVWFERLSLNNFFGIMRDRTVGLSVLLPNWFLFSLPNALWLFSGLLVFDFIWGTKVSVSKLFWLFTFCMIAFGAELGQAVGLLQGTFDWIDMILMLFAGVGAIPFIASSSRKERRKKV